MRLRNTWAILGLRVGCGLALDDGSQGHQFMQTGACSDDLVAVRADKRLLELAGQLGDDVVCRGPRLELIGGREQIAFGRDAAGALMPVDLAQALRLWRRARPRRPWRYCAPALVARPLDALGDLLDREALGEGDLIRHAECSASSADGLAAGALVDLVAAPA